MDGIEPFNGLRDWQLGVVGDPKSVYTNCETLRLQTCSVTLRTRDRSDQFLECRFDLFRRRVLDAFTHRTHGTAPLAFELVIAVAKCDPFLGPVQERVPDLGR